MLTPVRRLFYSNFIPDTMSRGKITEPTWKDTVNQVRGSFFLLGYS